jgi:hypothetical protein
MHFIFSEYIEGIIFRMQRTFYLKTYRHALVVVSVTSMEIKPEGGLETIEIAVIALAAVLACVTTLSIALLASVIILRGHIVALQVNRCQVFVVELIAV